MTQKDLLYLEDAVLHEENLIEICSYYSTLLTDKDLKTLLNKEIKKHNSIKDKIIKVMEDISNE